MLGLLEQWYALSAAQSIIFNDARRHRVIVAGRRFGKTWLALIWLLTVACAIKRSKCWYLAPTRPQAKDIAWEDLKLLVPSALIRKNGISETELTVTLINGSKISLKGTENFETLRGRGLTAVVLDEFADMKKGVWTVVRPQLSDLGKEGRAMFIGTPRGYDEFKELYDRAREGRPGWGAHHFTTLQGGNVSAEELVDARRDMNEREFRQEYLATFEMIEGRILHAFVREKMEKGNLDASVHDLGGPVLVGMDFNVNPMCATFSSRTSFARSWGTRWECHTWGELVMPNSNTDMMMAEIKRKFPNRPLVVFPDPTGGARNTAAGGKTDFGIIRQHGGSVWAPSSTYRIADKYNTFNAMLCNSLGERRQVVNPIECPTLVNAMDGLCYKEGTNQADKTSGLDHITDAHAYKLLGAFPIGVGAVKVQEVIF